MNPRTTHSTCYMCTNNCPITVISDGDRILAIDHPECARAAAMMEQRESPLRLTAPRVRPSADGPWREVSWDAALSAAAKRMLEIRSARGPEAVVFAAGYTKEVRPYLRRLARLFGSPHYVTESSCCFYSGYVAARVTLGAEYEYFLAPSRRRYPQTKCRLVWSNNPEESQLPYGSHHLLVDTADVPTVVVDPRRTSLAEAASIHLMLRPGTDGALALGLAHVIFEKNLQDQDFLRRHAHGLDAYRRYIREFTPDKTSAITGIPRDRIVEAAALYGSSHPSQITISPCATVHHSNGFQAHRAILLLAAVCGNLDVEGGNRPWNDRVQERSVDFADDGGGLPASALGAQEFPLFVRHCGEAQGMLLAGAIESGRVTAVVSVGLNLMMWPNSARLARACRSLDLFTTCDFFSNPTVEAATVFFPAATHLERQALVVSGSGRVQYRPAAVPPRGQARGDTELIFGLAERLGFAGSFWNGDIRASYDERLQGSGLRFADLPQDGQHVKVAPRHFSERSYLEKGFGTPTGKVEFVSTELERAGYEGLPVFTEPYWSPFSSSQIARDYPLVLTSGGRSRYFTHSQGRQLPSLREYEPAARVQLHPADAQARGISDGERVEVFSPVGSIEMTAWVTPVVPRGVVHAFHGWEGHNINQLIPDTGLDPVSGFPPFKSSLCQVRKLAGRDSIELAGRVQE
jgi:anaerobic selenocysteine-containing dehydrogenase